MKARTWASILILILAVLLISSCATERIIRTANRGNLRTVNRLIDKGVDVNVSGRYGFFLYPRHSTALMRASIHGHTEVVQLLIDTGANVNARDVGGAQH
jgi:ankyrin repeat protein